ncbi:hypothetical protein RHSIM_Rhsim02G0172700 [Rhododendron simsii]|uniref:Uncharacterized protein n=1 Tax=Rhododendron simsii TaxID=118357 RepID=A0A834LYC9_RHOSS|nr:hypothetical protein RHSIM_Rhsim02G0172700 [Rhododendron simsii]
MQRNNHVAKFRDQGLEHKELMDHVYHDVTAMGNDYIFPGEGIEEITEGSDELDGTRVHGGNGKDHGDKGKDPIGRTSIVGGSYSLRKHKLSNAQEAIFASFAESVDRFKSTPKAIAKDDMYACKDMPDIHLNFAAQEDIKGLLYPTMANTEDMEIVWHGIMAALQYEWEALGQPRRRQRT